MTANRIWDDVFLGAASDCPPFRGLRLNTMLPHQLCSVPFCYPMLALDKELGPDGLGVSFPRANLDAIAVQLERMYRSKLPVLVHCAMGIERSPLAVAWWLHVTRKMDSFDEAYDWVQRQRTQVQDRKRWIT